MKHIVGIENISAPFHNAIVTMGNFDGVHIGHQALFKTVIDKAHQINGAAIAMTFDPHPIKVLRPGEYSFPLITMNEQKFELISQSGLDYLITIPFTQSFASISANEFIETILFKRIGAITLVVGADYSFGKKREGNIDLLNQFGKKLGFDVIVVPWIPVESLNNERVSSTRIRELVQKGDLYPVQMMLGRYYQVRGSVTHGRNRGGKLLGFPTANITLSDELKPAEGVYAVIVEYEHTLYDAVANIGYCPTFDDNQYTIEVHILDFSKDIYGEAIKVNFIKRLRGEMKFKTPQDLMNQIQTDIQTAREILKSLDKDAMMNNQHE